MAHGALTYNSNNLNFIPLFANIYIFLDKIKDTTIYITY